MPPIVDPQMPNAIARSRPWKVAFTIESVEGRISAPPTPWRNRPRSTVPFGARAVTRLAARKTTRPSTKTRRLPPTSPTRPTLISSAAKTSE